MTVEFSQARSAWLMSVLFLVTGCLALVDFKETCLTDSDCASGLLCNSGQCTNSCNAYSNCGANMQCDLQLNKCVAIPSCNAGNAAQVCGKYACNASTGSCYTDCRGPNSQDAPAQCGASTVCATDFSCRFPCADTYDPLCTPYVCDTIMGYCGDYCLSSADCASGYLCSTSDTCSR